MQASFYVKTDAGVEEVHNKGHKLPSKLRTMLILIDGSKPLDVLKEQAAKIGAQDDFLRVLEDLELITLAQAQGNGRKALVSSPVESDSSVSGEMEHAARRFLEVQKFMNITAVNSSPMRSFFFTLKLEKCSTIDDLEALLEDYQTLITKGSGSDEAEILIDKVIELLKA